MLLSLLLLLAPALVYASKSPINSFHKRTVARSLSDGEPVDFEYFFAQLIDHTNPSLGTFQQRYFFSDAYWKGNGSPIILSTPGEQTADGFDSDLDGGAYQHALMSAFGAAGVVLEHRYWGKSTPFDTLTTANLQYLTVEQAIEDMRYFASNVVLPFNGINTSPDQTPWVHVGCSYPGLLAAFTQEKYPDFFAAAYATSAPVQANGDFWEYWEPIEEGMPQNCSADMAASVVYMDNIMTTGTPAQVTSLKSLFGLEALQNDDFAAALMYPINGWQDLQPTDFVENGQNIIFSFCDAVETKADGSFNTAAAGLGLPLALNNWAAAFKTIGPDAQCPGVGGACYSTYDYTSGTYTDLTTDDAYSRQWTWLLCNQLGWFQVGDPGNSSSIISGQVTAAWSERQCDHMFTDASGNPGNYQLTTTVGTINTEFNGWNLMAPQLFVVNGQYDPWRSASLSSKWGGSFADTPTQEITVIPAAHHCWDQYLDNSLVNSDVMNTQILGITTLHGWLTTWYSAHSTVKNSLPDVPTATANLKKLVGLGSLTANPTAAAANPLSTGIPKEAWGSTNGPFYTNPTFALVSFILNCVFIGLVTSTISAYIKVKRQLRAIGAVNAGGSWINDFVTVRVNGARVGQGSNYQLPLINRAPDLGEYGGGPMAGGRGKYQGLYEQH